MPRRPTQRVGALLDGEEARGLTPLLGPRIKAARLALGMQQTELARQLRTTKETVSRIERGASAPSLGRLSRIAALLHVPVTAFLDSAADGRRVEAAQLLAALSSTMSDEQWQGLLDTLRGLCRLHGVWPTETRAASESPGGAGDRHEPEAAGAVDSSDSAGPPSDGAGPSGSRTLGELRARYGRPSQRRRQDSGETPGKK
jgi:transcriptional regulator with XRE-family HTH domain